MQCERRQYVGTMVRIRLFGWKYVGRRKTVLLIILVAAFAVTLLSNAWWFAKVTSSVLRPPPPLGHDLHHFKRERNLKRYLDSIQVLIEPSSTRCEGPVEVPLLVLVTSAPSCLEERFAIRETWGARLPTYFVLGLDMWNMDEQLANIYLEAKEYSDMVVFDLVENYQNLTLKTALILEWTRRRCPQAEALLKTDDDVLVNPWVMMELVKEHADHQLVGYRRNQSWVHRDEYTKWYMPRWLFPENVIPQYLSGTGYIIYGEYIEKLLKEAYKIPIINLEDVYFTYSVAHSLGLKLTHDRRLSPFKPWAHAACAYWGLALAHSLAPEEIRAAWARVEGLGKNFERGEEVCGILGFLSNDVFLY